MPVRERQVFQLGPEVEAILHCQTREAPIWKRGNMKLRPKISSDQTQFFIELEVIEKIWRPISNLAVREISRAILERLRE